jgi:hypothetical protein
MLYGGLRGAISFALVTMIDPKMVSLLGRKIAATFLTTSSFSKIWTA